MSKPKSVFQLLFFSSIRPALFVVLLCIIEGVKQWQNISLFRWGVYPRDLEGIGGVFFSPLIHSNWDHLWNNSIPLLILGTTLVWFHRKKATKIWIIIWLVEGLGVWLTGRPYFHVGASGLVYGLFSFIVSYGVVTKNREHLGAAFLSVFLYGSMVWGIFPVRPEHSWEGHLWGFLIGIALGVYYGRKRVLEKKQAILHETYFHSSSDVEGLEWNYSYFDNEEKTSEKEEYKQ